MNWLKMLLLLLAFGHLLVGAYALSQPQAVAEMMSLEATTPGAVGELRAVFGGLIVALGLMILRGALGGYRGRQWLLAVSLAYFGLVLGRIVSLLMEGLSAHTLTAGALEAGLGVLLFYAAIDIARPVAGNRADTPTVPHNGPPVHEPQPRVGDTNAREPESGADES